MNRSNSMKQGVFALVIFALGFAGCVREFEGDMKILHGMVFVKTTDGIHHLLKSGPTTIVFDTGKVNIEQDPQLGPFEIALPKDFNYKDFSLFKFDAKTLGQSYDFLGKVVETKGNETTSYDYEHCCSPFEPERPFPSQECMGLQKVLIKSAQYTERFMLDLVDPVVVPGQVVAHFESALKTETRVESRQPVGECR